MHTDSPSLSLQATESREDKPECLCVSEYRVHQSRFSYAALQLLSPCVRIKLFPEVIDKSSQLFYLKEQDKTESPKWKTGEESSCLGDKQSLKLFPANQGWLSPPNYFQEET